MKTSKELFQTKVCYVNNQKKNGKVLAISTHVNQRRVCFKFEGDEKGTWMPESALLQTVNSTDKTSKQPRQKEIVKQEAEIDVKNLINLVSNTSFKFLNQHLDITGKAISKLNSEIASLANSTQEVAIKLTADTHKILVSAVEETTQVIGKTVGDTHATIIKTANDTYFLVINVTDTTTSAIIKFPNDVYITLCSGADTSTKTIATIFEDVQSSITTVASIVILLTEEEVIQKIKDVVSVVDIVVKATFEYVSNSWNRHWKDRILSAIYNKEFDFNSAQKVVDLLKVDFPNVSNREVSERLIQEKSVFATVVSLINEIPAAQFLNVVTQGRTNFLNMTNLIQEMIYQIFYAYNIKEFVEGDILAINVLCFSAPILKEFGLNLLESAIQSVDQIPVWGIKPVSNFMLLLVIGYTACEFCELKIRKINPLESEKEWKLLESKTSQYTIEVASNEELLEKSLEESLAQVILVS